MQLDYQTPPRPEDVRQRRRTLIVRVVLAVVAAVVIARVMSEALRPPSGKVSEAALRARCIYNLKLIGAAIQQYATANQGYLPPSLLVLAIDRQLNMQLFECPSSNAERLTPSTMPIEPGPQQAFVGSHAHRSYDYALSAGMNCTLSSLPSDAVLVVELLGNHDSEGVHVLFADGSVQWVPADQAAAAKGLPSGKAGQLLNDLKVGSWPLRVK